MEARNEAQLYAMCSTDKQAREVEARSEPSVGHVLWFRDPSSGVLCELFSTENGLYRAPYYAAMERGARMGRWEGPAWQRERIVRVFSECVA